MVPLLDEHKRLVDIVTAQRFPFFSERKVVAHSKAPVRVSFAGGGSDLTHYFLENGGAVINATISLFCHATLKLREDKCIVIDSLDLDKKITFVDFSDFMKSSDEFSLFRSVLGLIQPSFGFDL